MTVAKLGSGNRIEVFERPKPSETDTAKARKVIKATPNFDFDQKKCQAFMNEHGETLLGFFHSETGDQEGRLRALEDVLVEQGLCAGAKERIPCVLASTLREKEQTPYPVVRVIFENKKDGWQLLGQLDGETILLGKEDGRWWIQMPCFFEPRINGYAGPYHTQRLIFAPERFLRFSEKFERYFNIEKTALETLNRVFTNRNLPDLVMQYLDGYPAEVEKQNAEADREKLMQQVDKNPQRSYKLPYPSDELPFIEVRRPSKAQRILNLAPSWLAPRLVQMTKK